MSKSQAVKASNNSLSMVATIDALLLQQSNERIAAKCERVLTNNAPGQGIVLEVEWEFAPQSAWDWRKKYAAQFTATATQIYNDLTHTVVEEDGCMVRGCECRRCDIPRSDLWFVNRWEQDVHLNAFSPHTTEDTPDMYDMEDIYEYSPPNGWVPKGK